MNFWDTSALVPLCAEEPTTASVRALFSQDSAGVIWAFTPTEILSALCRRQREGHLTEKALISARRRRDTLCKSMVIVTDMAGVMARADRVLMVHALRAADALQLAAALVVASAAPPESVGFLTFDTRLAAAARKEGFLTPLSD